VSSADLAVTSHYEEYVAASFFAVVLPSILEAEPAVTIKMMSSTRHYNGIRVTLRAGSDPR
jgi:hypothetical protein